MPAHVGLEVVTEAMTNVIIGLFFTPKAVQCQAQHRQCLYGIEGFRNWKRRGDKRESRFRENEEIGRTYAS